MSAHLRSAEHPMIRGYVQEMVYATVIRVIVMIDIQVILRLQTILVQLYETYIKYGLLQCDPSHMIFFQLNYRTVL